MNTDTKYPTPEDVKAYDEKIAGHPILKTMDYIERYKANPIPETLNSIMSDIIMEIPVLQKKLEVKSGKSKTVFFGILNTQNDKWRSFVRRCGNKELSQHAFENVIYKQMTGMYIEWIRYRKLTIGRK